MFFLPCLLHGFGLETKPDLLRKQTSTLQLTTSIDARRHEVFHERSIYSLRIHRCRSEPFSYQPLASFCQKTFFSSFKPNLSQFNEEYTNLMAICIYKVQLFSDHVLHTCRWQSNYLLYLLSYFFHCNLK